MGLLEGTKAIITGAGSGIGAATARRFVAEGAQVALLDRNAETVQSVAHEVGGLATVVDVCDRKAMQAAFDRAAEQMGGLNAVFNNAGVGGLNHLHEYGPDEFALLIDVNFTSVWHGISAAVPHMAEHGGCIVNNTSLSSLRPTRGEGPYSAAKAAVNALTQSAALEYGPNIRVNGVLPGFIRTGLNEFICDTPELADGIVSQTPLGRIGDADEVANVVVFLCSPMASYVTGQNLVIDGGSALINPQVDSMLRSFLPDDSGSAAGTA